MACEVIEGLDRLSGRTAGGVLTIGNFDGVHLGHQRLLARASELARQAATRLCVLTFDPPPAVMLDETAVPERIMPEAVKHRHLARRGAELIVVIETTADFLSTAPEDFVRDVVAALARGVDFFDCVLPTRNGRNASAFTFDGPVRVRNEQFRTDKRPVEADCDCPACRRFSRGALRHLFMAGEMLGPILLSTHNLRFYMRLFERLREGIREGRLEAVGQALLDRYGGKA